MIDKRINITYSEQRETWLASADERAKVPEGTVERLTLYSA